MLMAQRRKSFDGLKVINFDGIKTKNVDELNAQYTGKALCAFYTSKIHMNTHKRGLCR